MDRQYATHEFPAILAKDSRCLILGSFPSVLSRKHKFFYMHPQNRFWKVLEAILGEPFSTASVDEKRRFLITHKIALYDVVESCYIKGSADVSIDVFEYAPIEEFISSSSINRIFVNGKRAWALFQKQFPQYCHIATVLPSTSAANASWTLNSLIDSWQIIRSELYPNSEGSI